MTKLNQEAGASVKDSSNKLPLDANVLMSRVCKLEEHLKAGLIELKSAVYGTEEVRTPDTLSECAARITKFETHVKEEIAKIKSALVQTDTKLDDLHQRMLSNNLIFFGIQEKTEERVKTTICETVRDQLGYIIGSKDIDFSFRLGKLGSHHCRPILVGFVNRNNVIDSNFETSPFILSDNIRGYLQTRLELKNIFSCMFRHTSEKCKYVLSITIEAIYNRKQCAS
ncbi:hypothetical protein HUJ04_004745 [Dendroctonus ponderosae]|nr:hypothetical protein HUJ04_004745 [Dendroctonus ponderosae]